MILKKKDEINTLTNEDIVENIKNGTIIEVYDDVVALEMTNWKYNSIWNFNHLFRIFLIDMKLNYYFNSLNFLKNDFKNNWKIENFEFYQHDDFFFNTFLKNDENVQSSFISFFTSNMVDVPICFKKSKSLKNKNFEFFFLKFANLLMRKGKKEQIFRFLLKSFFTFSHDIQCEKFKNFQIEISWFELYCFLNKKIKYLHFKKPINFFFDEINLLNNNHYDFIFKNFDINFFIKNFIKNKFSQISPLFLYFTYNVDKNVKKFTRGKSGKYVFVWKYIAPYKRTYLMLRWFIKEMRFDESREFLTRLKNMLNLVIFNLENTFAWKARNYSYALIFKNFRKTLMMSLKTIKKQ